MMKKAPSVEPNSPVHVILQLLDERNKLQKDLTNHLGVADVVMAQWKDGSSKSYTRHIVKIAEYLGVSPDYILGTHNDRFDTWSFTEREVNLIELFRNLRYEVQENIIRNIRFLNENVSRENVKSL
jgi:transcriptional regulator with XRE-family HTH domain